MKAGARQHGRKKVLARESKRVWTHAISCMSLSSDPMTTTHSLPAHRVASPTSLALRLAALSAALFSVVLF